MLTFFLELFIYVFVFANITVCEAVFPHRHSDQLSIHLPDESRLSGAINGKMLLDENILKSQKLTFDF